MSKPKSRTASQLRASRFNYLRRHAHGMATHAEAVIKDYHRLDPVIARQLEKAYRLYLEAIDAAHHVLIHQDWNSR